MAVTHQFLLRLALLLTFCISWNDKPAILFRVPYFQQEYVYFLHAYICSGSYYTSNRLMFRPIQYNLVF